MDIPIKVWHMVKVMQRVFNEHQMTQVPITVNQLARMQKVEDVYEPVGMNYPNTPDSRHAAQPVDEFPFPWEKGSVEKPITIEEDDGFSEPMTPVSESPTQPPALEARPALRCIENLQNLEKSAA